LFGQRCASKGYESLFKWGFDNGYRYDDIETTAAAGSSLSLLQWASHNGITISDKALKRAAMSGNIETMSWLVDEGHCEWNSCVLAKIPDEPDIMEWVKRRQYRHWLESLHSLCDQTMNGNLEIIKWYFASLHMVSIFELKNMFFTACGVGHIHIIEWILQCIPNLRYESSEKLIMDLFSTGFMRATRHGQKHVLNWLWDHKPIDLHLHNITNVMILSPSPPPLTSDAKRRVLECTLWMASHGCPHDKYDISQMRDITPEIMHCLSNNDGAEWKDVTISQLIVFGNIEFLQSALHNGCRWGFPLSRYYKQRETPDLNIVKWMIENGYPLGTAIYFCTDDISTLDYCVKSGIPIPSSYNDIFDLGDEEEFKSLELLMWFQNHGIAIAEESLICSLATFTVDEVKKYCKLCPEKNVSKAKLLCAAICYKNKSLSNWLLRNYNSEELTDLPCGCCCCQGDGHPCGCFLTTLFKRGKSTRRLIEYHNDYGLTICPTHQKSFEYITLLYSNKKEELEALKPSAVMRYTRINDFADVVRRAKWRSVKWLIQHGYKRNDAAYVLIKDHCHDPLFLQWVDENWKTI